MNTKFIPVIIKNIEIPESHTNGITSVLRQLEIGDGFDFPKEISLSTMHTLAKRAGIHIRTKKNRLWRDK